MKRYAKPILLLLFFVAVAVAIRVSGLASYLTFGSLKAHQAYLFGVVDAHYGYSLFLYIIAYAAVTGFSIPGATIMTLAGGLLFHTFPGVVYVNVGATTGAVLAFSFSRHIVGNRLQEKYASQLARFNRELDENGAIYLLIVRLIPVFPFFLINVLSGLTRVHLGTYIWTTSLGILPGSLVYTFAGSQLGTLKSPSDLTSPRLVAAFLLLALFAVLPLLWRKLKGRGRSIPRQ